MYALAGDRAQHAPPLGDDRLIPGRSNSFELASGEVHTWCVSLDVALETRARLYATLPSDERGRSARFRFERDRRRFIVAHGVLRDLLGRYLRVQPDRIAYAYNSFGKPDLGPEFHGRLRFNLSHSAGLALIAIAADADVGVDLERIRALSDPAYAEISRSFLSRAEGDQLSGLGREFSVEAFLGCWTKKEAYLKACGNGLARPLNSFSVPVSVDPAHAPIYFSVASNGALPAKKWSFYTLEPAPGYIGALVIEGSGWRLSQRQWKMAAAEEVSGVRGSRIAYARFGGPKAFEPGP